MKILIVCLFAHLLGDFFFQPRWMGKTKSSKFWVLTAHLGIITLFQAFLLIPYRDQFLDAGYWWFLGLNALAHGMIDWNIWKLYKLSVALRNPGAESGPLAHYWQYWEDPWFYHTIGVDQFLHILTFIILLGWLLPAF
jgi:hypothetical protein